MTSDDLRLSELELSHIRIKDLEKEIRGLKRNVADNALALALIQEVDVSNHDKVWLKTRWFPALELLGIKRKK